MDDGRFHSNKTMEPKKKVAKKNSILCTGLFLEGCMFNSIG